MEAFWKRRGAGFAFGGDAEPARPHAREPPLRPAARPAELRTTALYSSRRELPPEALALVEDLMALAHVVPADRLAAEEVAVVFVTTTSSPEKSTSTTYGITVNGVEPGLVLTPGAEAATTSEERDALARFIPLKRWGTPMEAAHAMLYLASEGASYVTGQTIIVDGGALLPENGALMT